MVAVLGAVALLDAGIEGIEIRMPDPGLFPATSRHRR